MSESGGASHETERHRDQQPPREDLLEPEEIDVVPEEERPIDDESEDPVLLPDPEERPESQGDDVLDAERLTEDGVERRRGPTPPA